MFPTPLPRRALVFGALVSLSLTSAFGQNVLLAEHKKKFSIVRAARRERPMVEVDGKMVVADGNKFALKKVEEYLPVFVGVSHVRVRTSQIEMVDSGQSINHQFEFRADFTSAYPLENVFVVLALDLEDGSKSLFLHEIGRLAPGQPRNLDLAVRTGFPMGEGHYTFHVFVDGMEALHSEQPFNYREAALDRMVAKRISDRTDSRPEPFIGPPPEYPAKLLKTKRPGHAVFKLRVRTNGAVMDPKVESASEPEFGDAGITALRQWRFLPAVKGGHPVASGGVNITKNGRFENHDAIS